MCSIKRLFVMEINTDLIKRKYERMIVAEDKELYSKKQIKIIVDLLQVCLLFLEIVLENNWFLIFQANICLALHR